MKRQGTLQSLQIKNEAEWRKYSKSKDNPRDIPANPNVVYKKDWKSMGDWLGTGYIAVRDREYLPF